MAFVFDAKTSIALTTSFSVSVSHTTASGAELMVAGGAIRGSDQPDDSTVVYDGSLLDRIILDGFASDFEATFLYWLTPPSVGSNLFAAEPLVGGTTWGWSISTYFCSSPSLDSWASNSNSGTVVNPNVTVSGAGGGLGVDCVSNESNTGDPQYSGPGADQTTLHTLANASWGIATSYELAVAASETFNWTGSSGGDTATWCHVAATFVEGGGAVTPGVPTNIDYTNFPRVKRAGRTTVYA